jgi:hypothetical protein
MNAGSHNAAFHVEVPFSWPEAAVIPDLLPGVGARGDRKDGKRSRGCVLSGGRQPPLVPELCRAYHVRHARQRKASRDGGGRKRRRTGCDALQERLAAHNTPGQVPPSPRQRPLEGHRKATDPFPDHDISQRKEVHAGLPQPHHTLTVSETKLHFQPTIPIVLLPFLQSREQPSPLRRNTQRLAPDPQGTHW